MRLHHVQVSCPPGGEDVARAFYGDLLGLAEVDKPPVLAARLAAAGRPVRWDDDFPGYRRFHSADGHGNRVELLAVRRERPTEP